MVWNSTSPDGAQSVKANVPIQQSNTTYIEQTMGNVLSNTEPSQDHFWNLDPNSGHHRQVQMKRYSATYSGAPNDPTLAPNMEGSLYLKLVNGRVQGFFENGNAIYQYIPAFISGSFNVTSSFQNMVALPDNCYGQIWMILFPGDTSNMCYGVFNVVGGICNAFSFPSVRGNSTTPNLALRFASADQASGTNFRVKADNGPTGVYEYRLIYWAT